MILQLRILNFAIIEELQIEFHEGFNVLTGETGAGKSILLDALGLLLGERGSTDFIRHGQHKAEIEGLFSFRSNSVVIERLDELGIKCDDNTIVIRRDLTNQGKSICRINGQLVTIAMLKHIGEALVNFHSQHDHQQLLQAHRHLFWLDAFAGSVLEAELSEYQQIYREFTKVRKELEHLNRNEKELAQRIDLIRYQTNEIDQAQLVLGEDEILMEEKNKLVHAEKINKSVYGAYSALADEQRTLDWLGVSMSHLEEVLNLDPELQKKFQQIEESFYILDEITRELSSYSDKNEFDANRLDEIEDRLHTIHNLKRKYGESIAEILAYNVLIMSELEQLENRELFQSELIARIKNLRSNLILKAKTLTQLRQEAANHLMDEVKKELADLHMENAQFFVKIDDLSNEATDDSLDIAGGDYGMNDVEFMITTNPGEPLKPLSKVASGGELSRLVLALRTVLARIDDVDTLIFDEVDTGVSGRVTHAIGEKLLRISIDRQLLAITHHPQVASLADKHLLIEKHITGDRTKTKVIMLNEDDRVQELARMIGGNQISSSAKLHAAEMRRLGKQIKQGK